MVGLAKAARQVHQGRAGSWLASLPVPTVNDSTPVLVAPQGGPEPAPPAASTRRHPTSAAGGQRWPWLVVTVAHVLTLVVMTRSTPHRLATTLPHNLGDPALVTWILSWQTHAVLNDPQAWFDGNIFHPHGQALGYSELLLPLVPPFGLVLSITGNPLLAHNLVLLGLLLGSLLATHLLARRLGMGHVASFLAAFAFTFGAYTFAHASHLQLLTFGSFPLGLLALHSLYRHRRRRDGVLVGVVSAGLVTACLYYGVIWVVYLAVAAALYSAAVLLRRRPGQLVPLAVAAITTAVLLAPVGLLLLGFQQDVGFGRPLVEGSGLAVADLLTPAPGSFLYHPIADVLSQRPGAYEHIFFPGVAVMGLGLLGPVVAAGPLRRVVARFRAGDRRLRPVELSWLTIGLGGGIAFIISLGPSILGAPAPFRWLHQFVPGFDSIRAPSRLAVPALLGLALVAAWTAERIGRRFLTRPVLLPAALLAVTAVELLAPFPRTDARPPAVEEARYEAIASLPPGALVELPAAGSTAGVDGVYAEAQRMLFALGDWRPRFNGTSGGSPPGHLEQADVLNRFPDPDSLALATALDLRYVVLRVAEGGVPPYSLTPEDARARLAALPPDVAVAEIPGGYVVDLAP